MLMLVCEAWMDMRTRIQYQIVVVGKHCSQLGYPWIDRTIPAMLLTSLLDVRGGSSPGSAVNGGYRKRCNLASLWGGHGDEWVCRWMG